MEILERGNIRERKVRYIVGCSYCDSKLKCEEADIKTTGLFRFYTCPVCSNRNYIDEYDLLRARTFGGDS